VALHHLYFFYKKKIQFEYMIFPLSLHVFTKYISHFSLFSTGPAFTEFTHYRLDAQVDFRLTFIIVHAIVILDILL